MGSADRGGLDGARTAEPYRPPEARLTVAAAFDRAAEAQRRALLPYEATFVALGLGGLTAGIGTAAASLPFAATALLLSLPESDGIEYYLGGSAAVLLGAGALVTLAGARTIRMEGGALGPAKRLAALALATGPLGIPLGIGLLLLLRSARAAEVLTPEHRALRARTRRLDTRCALLACGLLAWGGAALVVGLGLVSILTL